MKGWQLWSKEVGPEEEKRVSRERAEKIIDHKSTDTKGTGISSHAPAPGAEALH